MDFTPDLDSYSISELMAVATGNGHHKPAAKPEPRPSWDERNIVKLSADRRYSCLLTCIRSLCKRYRNAKRRIFRIRLAVKALDLKQDISAKDLAQLILETLDDLRGNAYNALDADQRKSLVIPEVEWIWSGLLPANDGAIIGGRPKVGKTVTVYAAIAALLKQQPFLGQQPPAPRKVILISDDQGDATTRDLLRKYGIWDHPDLIWSSRFRISEVQIDRLLETIDANPGALVVIDSLRSTTRSSGFTEMDVEMGTILYDLKQAIVTAGGTLWVIHHCNKSDDNAVGIEALSGNSALAGAVNFTATLHHLVIDGKPQKSKPERRLFSEGRGDGLDLLITLSPETGVVGVLGSFEAHQEEVRVQANLCNAEKEILGASLTHRLAFMALAESKAVDAESGLGPLDLLKFMQLVPVTTRVMADLNTDQLKTYKNLTRWLDKLTGYVEKASPVGKQFKAYFLTETAIAWAAEQEWS